jgi:hypothetical protein
MVLAGRIATTDWPALIAGLGEQYNRILVTCETLLRLIWTWEAPSDLLFGRYGLVWGDDVASGMKVNERAVLRELGRLPSHLLVQELPSILLNTEADELSTRLHDLQNQLLNVQLRHEVFDRVIGFEQAIPQVRPPDRVLSLSERMTAAAAFLESWVNFDLDQLGLKVL